MTDALLIFDERTKWVTKEKNWLFKFHGNLTALLDGPQHLVSFRETSHTPTHGTPPPPLSPSSPKSQRYGFQSNIRIYYVVDGDWLSPTKFSKNKWQTLV